MIDEVQLTFGAYGHMLNSDHVFSPDGEWVVYDTRNDITHIGRTCCLEKVNIKMGEIVKLYDAPVLGVLWSKKGNVLVYNRFVSTGNARYLQIFKIVLN